MIRVVLDGTPEFDSLLGRLARRGAADLAAVEPDVRRILDEVRRGGDEAVLACCDRLEGRRPDPLFRRDYGGAEALGRLPGPLADALRLAADRIARYHERQIEHGFRYEEEAGAGDRAGGVTLGLRVRPVDRAGVYAPGGKARYPSSVLMAAVPARVAGVGDVLLATPRPDDAVLAAAHLAGVTGVLDAGGAHAIAALAFGTESVPRADKIVGPGNVWVACAKRLVAGEVGIDSIAGPSEILVLCDESADPEVVAADLLSQAEHDEAAYPLCVASAEPIARHVADGVEAQLATLPRRAIARAAVDRNGAIFVARPRERMAAVARAIAVEHLALHVARPDEMLDAVGVAGAAFVGAATPEAAGDYLAGPSHVLPTGGTVRFGSPLGVWDFVARTSVLSYTPEALARHAAAICELARAEGLEGHARAVELRLARRSAKAG